MSDDYNKKTHFNLNKISELIDQEEALASKETEVWSGGPDFSEAFERIKTKTAECAVLRPRGSYSLKGPSVPHKRLNLTEKLQSLKKSKTSRLKGATLNEPTTLPIEVDIIPAKPSTFRQGVQEVSFTTDHHQKVLDEVEIIESSVTFRRASEVFNTFMDRQVTKAFSSAMTPTLPAIEELPDQKVMAYLRLNPETWVELDSSVTQSEGLVVFVAKENSRLRVVFREGAITFKVEAFRSMTEASLKSAGELYMEIIS
jgi:hypothetical protein